jgi:hypothetical protein
MINETASSKWWVRTYRLHAHTDRHMRNSHKAKAEGVMSCFSFPGTNMALPVCVPRFSAAGTDARAVQSAECKLGVYLLSSLHSSSPCSLSLPVCPCSLMTVLS